MICPKCKNATPDDSIYCENCGLHLLICPKCGKPGLGPSCSADGSVLAYRPALPSLKKPVTGNTVTPSGDLESLRKQGTKLEYSAATYNVSADKIAITFQKIANKSSFDSQKLSCRLYVTKKYYAVTPSAPWAKSSYIQYSANDAIVTNCLDSNRSISNVTVTLNKNPNDKRLKKGKFYLVIELFENKYKDPGNYMRLVNQWDTSRNNPPVKIDINKSTADSSSSSKSGDVMKVILFILLFVAIGFVIGSIIAMIWNGLSPAAWVKSIFALITGKDPLGH